MATLTKGTTFASGDVVTPAKLNNLVDAAAVSNIVNTDISNSAAIADTKLANISSAGKVANSATTATNLNTANAIVARDASGNFSAGTITASLSGNSSTASQWAAGRNLSLTGDVTATLGAVNGSANVSAAATIASSAVTTAKIADSNVTTAKIADGSVTAAKLGNDIFLVPAGAVMPFAMNSAPSGWLAANGTAVSRTTYATLFAAIGTVYGVGDGSTTFNLPDLRGYFVRGSGTNGDGTVSGTFGAKQADGFESHTHTGSAASAGSHTHTFTTPNGQPAELVYYKGSDGNVDGSQESTGYDRDTALLNTYIQSAGSHTHAVTINATGTTETRPANIALLYCIKF